MYSLIVHWDGSPAAPLWVLPDLRDPETNSCCLNPKNCRLVQAFFVSKSATRPCEISTSEPGSPLAVPSAVPCTAPSHTSLGDSTGNCWCKDG